MTTWYQAGKSMAPRPDLPVMAGPGKSEATDKGCSGWQDKKMRDELKIITAHLKFLNLMIKLNLSK